MDGKPGASPRLERGGTGAGRTKSRAFEAQFTLVVSGPRPHLSRWSRTTAAWRGPGSRPARVRVGRICQNSRDYPPAGPPRPVNVDKTVRKEPASAAKP